MMHFHLKSGGVTTVIKQQAAVLRAAGHEVLIVCGESPAGAVPAPVTVVPGLGYEDAPRDRAKAQAIRDDVLGALARAWPGRPVDVLHVHNPTLAKNRNLQQVLKTLQRDGVPLLCQIHDLAEDGRPGAYFDEPYVADCHYATVNGRDRNLLIQAGLDVRGVHYLPNPIAPLPSSAATANAPPAPSPVLYPVRAIRRKNIGEAIFLHLFDPSKAPLYITLPPNSDQDLPAYRMWQAFAARHELKVHFEAGLHHDFTGLVACSRFWLTTSITEGFGFTFLDAWPAGKALWGRKLADICEDFEVRGVRLADLYDLILVPWDMIDGARLLRLMTDALNDALSSYGRADREAQAVRFRSWFGVREGVDFGLLDEGAQRTVLDRVLSDQSALNRLVFLNPFLAAPGPAAGTATRIAQNKTAVLRHFNTERYARRLTAAYDAVGNRPLTQHIDKRVLLDAFLSPERFTLLKWGAYHE
ncbi:MAG: glycosyltransferase [Desulfatitalea sp.]|nr:glycosyltransferase [Desulfatitalea sp.]NNK01828.1 glycosyltransferase [Desulfatitalea sp.]